MAEGNTTCDQGKHLRVDGSGQTRCDIPQVGARLTDCDQGCLDPEASFQAAPGQGWYYVPNAAEGPAVEFVGLVPSEGAGLSIQCR